MVTMCTAVVLVLLVVASATVGEVQKRRVIHDFHPHGHFGARTSPRGLQTEGGQNLHRPHGSQTFPHEKQIGEYQTFQAHQHDQALNQEVQSGGYQSQYGHQEPQTQVTQEGGHQNLLGLQSASVSTRDEHIGDQTHQGHNGVQTLAHEVHIGGHQNLHGHQGEQLPASQREGHQTLHGHQEFQTHVSQKAVHQFLHGYQSESVLNKDEHTEGHNIHGHIPVAALNQIEQSGEYQNHLGHQESQIQSTQSEGHQSLHGHQSGSLLASDSGDHSLQGHQKVKHIFLNHTSNNLLKSNTHKNVILV